MVGMIGHIAICFVKTLLDSQHLLKSCVPSTVDAGDEYGLVLFGFFPISGVMDDGLQIAALGFFMIFSVLYHTADTVFDGPDFCYGHWGSSPLSVWQQTCIRACEMVFNRSAMEADDKLGYSCCSCVNWA